MAELKVNGEVVSQASIEQERQQLMSELKLQPGSVSDDRIRLMIMDRARQNVIDHYLFKQEAKRQGIEIEPAIVETQVLAVADRNGGIKKLQEYLGEIGENIDDFRKHIEDRMLVDALVEKLHNETQIPKDRVLKKHYKENKDQFFTPEKVEAWGIVKKFNSSVAKRRARTEIEKIETALNAGKSFKLMVKQRSDDSRNDGFLGVVSKGQLGVVFDEFIFNAEPG